MIFTSDVFAVCGVNINKPIFYVNEILMTESKKSSVFTRNYGKIITKPSLLRNKT